MADALTLAEMLKQGLPSQSYGVPSVRPTLEPPPKLEPWVSRIPTAPPGWALDVPSLQMHELGGAPRDVARGIMPVGVGVRKFIPF